MEGGGRLSSCAPDNPALYVRLGTFVSGGLLIGSAIFRFIRLFTLDFDNPSFFVMLIWIAVFGVLLILAELEWPSCMASHFGFLMGIKGRGFFTFFAGTLALSLGFDNSNQVSGILLIVAGFIACGVSVLLFFCGGRMGSGADVEAPTVRGGGGVAAAPSGGGIFGGRKNPAANNPDIAI